MSRCLVYLGTGCDTDEGNVYGFYKRIRCEACRSKVASQSGGISMSTISKIVCRYFLYLLFLLVSGLSTSCAPAVHPTSPPDSYRGPRAEQPTIERGDYWLFERGNATRTKSAAIFPNIGFPLWIGKTWSYEGEARRANLPPSSTASPLRTQIDCYVSGFEQVTVRAGTFAAFQCKCGCELLSGMGQYEPEIGRAHV